MSFESSLSLHDGLRSCRSVSPAVKLELEANDEVDPEVTAAAAAAIEADVGTAVMEEVAEEDPIKQTISSIFNMPLIASSIRVNNSNYDLEWQKKALSEPRERMIFASHKAIICLFA